MSPSPKTRPEASKFLQLPTEVIVKILALLDIKEIVACQSVSSPSKEII